MKYNNNFVEKEMKLLFISFLKIHVYIYHKELKDDIHRIPPNFLQILRGRKNVTFYNQVRSGFFTRVRTGSSFSRGSDPNFSRGSEPVPVFSRGSDPNFSRGSDPDFSRGSDPDFSRGSVLDSVNTIRIQISGSDMILTFDGNSEHVAHV